MKKLYQEIADRKNVVIWGTGRVMRKSIDRISPDLDIIGFCDTFPHKWGTSPAKGLVCHSKEELSNQNVVLIAIESPKDIEAVSQEMDERGIDYCHIEEAVEAYRGEWEEKQIERWEARYGNCKIKDDDHIVKYVTCHVPYKFCNLQCSYCYVRQKRNFEEVDLKLPSARYIAKALSPVRLGGIALINFCAGGETLLVKELIPIIAELVKEGHYISIVTNGTVSSAFDELLKCGIDLKHIFIKFSFHYLELKRTKMLERYFENIRRVRKAGCSVSVELVPSDDLVPFIEEIKECCLRNVGALPHLTVPRDDRDMNLKILTEYDLGEYRRIWGQFNSQMFDFKLDNVSIKRFENCKAGEWSFQLNLETGAINKCLGNPYLDNIYDDICETIHLEAVGGDCCLPYCYNCHSYLALGLVEEIEAPTYWEVRDRETLDGHHWVTDEMKAVFTQKLYLNNRK